MTTLSLSPRIVPILAPLNASLRPPLNNSALPKNVCAKFDATLISIVLHIRASLPNDTI